MINVDTVYKTVLYILNKEQRGYITPDDFNRLGIQVQREIFEQYFEELNQQLRIHQTDNEYANRIKNLEEKIDIFKTTAACTGANPFTLPADTHRLGTLIYNVNSKEIQPIERNEYFLLNRSPLTQPTTSYPLYILEGTGAPSAAPSNVTVYPDTGTGAITTGEVDAYYIKAPSDIRWGFSVGTVGQYLYDPSAYVSTGINVGPGSLTTAITTDVLGAVGPFPATYVNPPFWTSGSGINATFTITTTSATTCTIDVTNSGSGYAAGDTITIFPFTFGLGSTGPIITLTQSSLMESSTYGSTQFELHPSEQTNVILNILMYSGIIIRDPSIVQTAATMVQQDEALEKS
jgi:hypothetical protein